MPTVIQQQIADAESKLTLLLREVRDGDPTIAQRVELWIARMCSGKKLAVFLNDEAISPKDRVTVARSLVDILLTRQLQRLPELPTAAEPAVPTPAPILAPPKPPEAPAPQREDERDTPAPDELRAMVDEAVRKQLAGLFEAFARVLRDTH